MNTFKYYFVLISVLLCACSSKNEISPWDSELSTEQNIAKNAVALENNEDFSFLDNIIRSRSIIILGEESHSDYSTSETKLKMINYLQNKGFHTVVFEGYPLLGSYVFSNPKFAKLTKNYRTTPFFLSTEVLINKTKEYQLFLKDIREEKIRIWGMDTHSLPLDIDAVKAILDEYSGHEVLSINWDKLKILYSLKYTQYGADRRKPSVAEQYELMRMIDSISNYTQYLMFLKDPALELKYIMQWIRNLNEEFSGVEYKSILGEEPTELMALSGRNRDIQMAENIDWIVKNFPDEKIIVWTANFHGAKDISQTQYSTDSLLYFTFQTMGEVLHNTYGSKVYSLAFASLNRSEYSNPGMLEKEISGTTGNAPYAFINFEPLRFADGYRDKEFESDVIIKKQGKWLYIFDGLYYIRDQQME